MPADLVAAWRDLGHLERRLLRSKRMEAELSAELWLASLEHLVTFDRHCGSVRRLARIVAIGSGVLAVVSLFFGPDFARLFGVHLARGHSIAAAGCLIVCLGCLGAWLVLRRVDIPEVLRQFVSPMVRVLREDMKPGTRLLLVLDLRGPTVAAKQVRSETGGEGSRQWTDTYFEDAWFLATTRLADGAKLHLRIADRVRKRSARRTNARGKVKRKTKYKTKRLTRAALGVRKGRFLAGAETAPRDTVVVNVKHKASRTEARYSKVLVWRGRPGLEKPPEVAAVIDLIASAYRAVESSTVSRG